MTIQILSKMYGNTGIENSKQSLQWLCASLRSSPEEVGKGRGKGDYPFFPSPPHGRYAWSAMCMIPDVKLDSSVDVYTSVNINCGISS